MAVEIPLDWENCYKTGKTIPPRMLPRNIETVKDKLWHFHTYTHLDHTQKVRGGVGQRSNNTRLPLTLMATALATHCMLNTQWICTKVNLLTRFHHLIPSIPKITKESQQTHPTPLNLWFLFFVSYLAIDCCTSPPALMLNKLTPSLFRYDPGMGSQRVQLDLL